MILFSTIQQQKLTKIKSCEILTVVSKTNNNCECDAQGYSKASQAVTILEYYALISESQTNYK